MSDVKRRGRPKGGGKGTAPRISGRYFRLVIPNLTDFTNLQDLLCLKGDTLNLILTKQSPVGLQYYSIATQIHPTTGVPHLDILLLFKKSRFISLNRFDYLVKHGDLTRYKKLNQAILEYSLKEDPNPLTNMKDGIISILQNKALESDPYLFLQNKMKEDPFKFDLAAYCSQKSYFHSISNWAAVKSKLKDSHQAECNKRLMKKPGFKPITRCLIQDVLSPVDLKIFDSWKGFQKVVDKLNEAFQSGPNRRHKSKQLFIVGRPDIGKTTLALKVQQHISVYPMNVHNWFPRYRSGVYKMILWNQFGLRIMPYPELLNFLEGCPMDLRVKGGYALKRDNPLIFMTSNMTLQQHICNRFHNLQNRDLARANLRARIEQIIVPENLDLFFLTKLLKRD